MPEAYCWCLWNPSLYRRAGCPYLSAALGENLPQNQLIAAAKVWNDRLDAWKAERNPMEPVETLSKYGDAPHLLQFEPAVWQILCPFRHEADAKTG